MAGDSLNVTASYIHKLRTSVLPHAQSAASGSLTNAHRLTRRNKNDEHIQNTEQPFCPSQFGLPSFVEDSEKVHRVNDISPDHLEFLSPNAVKRLRAMNSQGDLANGTQLISQSFYESIIRKERSTRQDTQNHTDTQKTYDEGDSGHVDITSSFVTRNDKTDDLADSEPVDFSPVQTQNQLTQFPESQRFKTPATAGKKRKYNGQVVDTPAPVRNPVGSNAQTTHGGILGLSQAFAATQAPSSPLTNGPPTDLRSDRPSPGFDLQTRPATALSSSPSLRPISDLKRAVTEPVARYVPMKQSQADREHQVMSECTHDATGGDVFDDDFDGENSLMAQERRRRERKQKLDQELRTLSSPIISAKVPPISSAPDVLPQHTRKARRTQSLPPESSPGATGSISDTSDVDSVSEAETERDDEAHSHINRSSQIRNTDGEDKENDSVLVPKTGPRRRHEIFNAVAHVDASPSIRQNQNVPLPPTPDVEMHSSEPFRIMDSQPSQSRPRLPITTESVVHHTSDAMDLSEQSPSVVRSRALSFDEPGRPHYPGAINSDVSSMKVEDDQIDASAVLLESRTPTTEKNTVYETSSTLRAGRVGSGHAAPRIDKLSRRTESATNSTFETAPTHSEPTIDAQSPDVSSPIHTTPPGRKRRRLLEISAEPSPLKSQSQPSFDADIVLQLDGDQQVVELLQSSPSKNTYTTTRTTSRSTDSSDTSGKDVCSSQPSVDFANATNTTGHLQQNGSSESDEQDGHVTEIDLSQDIVRPGRHSKLSQLSVKPQTLLSDNVEIPLVSRQPIFDIPGSPQPRASLRKPQRKLQQISIHGKRHSAKDDVHHESSMDKRLRQGGQEQRVSPVMASNNDADVMQPRSTDRNAAAEGSSYKPSAEKIIAPNMVLAFYKGDPRGYYPAKVLATNSKDGYQIQWEGYDPEFVDVYGVKALDLRIGDTIKVLAEGFGKHAYTIRAFKDKITDDQNGITDIRGYRTVVVTMKQRKSLAVNVGGEKFLEVSISTIYLDVNMWSQLKSRNEEVRPDEPLNIASGVATPLLRGSSPATPSSRSRRLTLGPVSSWTIAMPGLFANMAFALSYDDSAQKNLLTNMIQTNGGFLIHDSFHDLLEPNMIQPRPQYANLGFTVLLTDRHSRKEKYMQALALGLPCLSGKWVESCIKHGSLQDWHSYLLPAGESAELDNATRSRVLPANHEATTKFKEMIDSRPNLLNGAPVVMVVGRGKSEQKRAPYLFLIKAIGAGQIHQIPDTKSAHDFLISTQGIGCEWVFVDDRDVQAIQDMVDKVSSKKSRGRAKTKRDPSQPLYTIAGNELIVQSLILGKLYEG